MKKPNLKSLVKEAKKKEENLSKLRNERCVPMAVELMKAMASHDGHKLGDVTHEELMSAYEPVVIKLFEKYMEANITVGDAQVINAFAMQAFESVNTMMVETLNSHLRNVQKKKFGSQLNELTFKQLDELLKSDTVKEESSK